ESEDVLMARNAQTPQAQGPAVSKNGTPSNGQANKPAEIRLGRIKAVIWTNQGDNGTWYNIQFRRIYRDENGWQSSDSFRRAALPLLAKVADRAPTWCYQQQARNAAKNDSASEDDASGADPDHIPF